jgi:uncharacterized protein
VVVGRRPEGIERWLFSVRSVDRWARAKQCVDEWGVEDEMAMEDDSNGKAVKQRRGFALLSPERLREISRRGGVKAHENGKAHEFTSEEASAAGRLGGLTMRKMVPEES